MTPTERAKEIIKVMQHFANGGEVECRTARDWFNAPNPSWNWGSADYRIKQPVDHYAELKAAAKDPTKQIRALLYNGRDWQDAGYDWKWCYMPEVYEIRDKPKKVKLLAWFDGCVLFWREERYNVDPTWDRVPYEDKEIEIDE